MAAIKSVDISDIDFVLSDLVQNNNQSYCMYHHSVADVLAEIKQKCIYIEAAGGLVSNEHNEILCIYRLNMWDLPKGKLQKGESTQAAAIREVQEETGLVDVTSNTYLCSTWHTYMHPKKQKLVVKQTYWYTMTATKNQTIQPQTNEHITDVCWVPKQEIESIITHTYQSIVDVLRKWV